MSPAATAILGDGGTLLRSVVPLLTNQSVFLYIDPFGLDCEFESIEPFIMREKSYSTEILINLHMPILHRLASREKILDGSGDSQQIAMFHNKLTRTLGGDYWKDAMLSDNGWDTKTREQAVIDGYKQRLSSTNYLTFTGSCPVQKSRDSVTKYHMVFASPHPDAMYLFNEAMCKAFNRYMTEEETKETLFADTDWREWRDTNHLTDLVVQYVEKFPSSRRKDLWLLIIRDHFMRFTDSEYKKAVTQALAAGKILCSTPPKSPLRPTNKLNGDCVLEPNRNRLF